MFKHILIPTDGSKLAKALGARVTAVYVIQSYVPAMYGEAAIYIPATAPQEYKKVSERAAKKALAALIFGSETQRVLAHSKIPVLVSR